MLKKLVFPLILTLIMTVTASADSAKSSILADAESGRIIYSKNARQKLGMASTTKIMTAIVALENSSLDEIVTVSYAAASTEGSSMYLKAGEKIKMESLLYGLMLNSGNDAATAIAEHIGKSTDEFAELMNEKAEKIGLKDTHFSNPHGLDNEQHYSTAYDMAMLARYAMKNEKFREIVSSKKKTVEKDGIPNSRYLTNHNRLLGMYEYCTGIKTGFTKSCGRCLVSSAEKDGVKLIAVTLCDPDDWNDHISMYNDAFSKYSSYVIIPKNSYVCSVEVPNLKTTAALYAKDDIRATLTEQEYNNLSVEYNTEQSVNAPVYIGQKLGTAVVMLGSEPIGSTDLITRYGIELKYKSGISDKFMFLVTSLLSLFKVSA